MDKTTGQDVYEAIMDRLYKVINRLILALCISVAVGLITNAVWLWAFTQYEYVSDETKIINSDGVSNFIGNDGEIENGD